MSRLGTFLNHTCLIFTIAVSTTLIAPIPATAQDQVRQAPRGEEAPYTMSDVMVRITMGLESGRITPAQAAEYLVAAQQKLDNDEAVKAYTAELVEAYEAGEISRVEIGSKVAEFKKELGTAMIMEARTSLGKAVRSGTLTREQAGEVWRVYEDLSKNGTKKKTISRADYDKAVAEMTEMVKAGDITREQMQQRLNRMKKMMGKPRTITREDYAKAEAKMKKMVAAGEITEADMKTRLAEMRKMISITRADYAKAEAKMKAMVAAGEITQAQMDARLEGMKKKMTKTGDLRAQYAGMQQRLEQAVKAGKMTQEEADEKLKAYGAELRKKATGGEKSGAGDARAAYMGMKLRFDNAVKEGKMTQEEADEKLAEFRLSLGR